MRDAPPAGAAAAITGTVPHARTAAALAGPGEALPPVFGTPFMIADMERACAAILAPLLRPGEVSVGVKIEVAHEAPTPGGVSVGAEATFTGQDGPLYWFDVSATDPGGTIGRGRIARAIVPEDKLIAKAETRR
ncbi:MAG: thioesterase [Pseudomonadota bacterium]